ncbi:hypothetical protein A2643_01870 [Candidatus Nomurabacteria bacterium RIFCSPHIGHO2_01_FULL_39_220]|uniref:Uncharacterized protein n=1 Tax=Candidatus Nomurabacteria bacterium RIFCSPLOWO2_02_FULL_40_67 TaxID=1801787 RepID=A0A1F6Y6T7_9BACT|nr:MAG: hypothetical protein UU01_C0007G0006 [Parcubacteria group bacterium GW2011_GWA2_40_37]KKS11759.1 MAG: hypothetical protein UU66_C0009G0002 [Parcubacteria group bacterium GW2011_GWB1_41_5]KKS72269.1 MAG: hypothetical protein UV43_C0019G0006 [Parcubacteria group bacterium GW2011_GWF2_42_7]OGI62893.1 MAG: hypothetical protein A2W12_02410 [Candidatus Nomurabacteria bacterium RBG_16_40_11]OGI70465.1 MAG: hypothetical protein A2643_01870 [Candidatus Nomurabacteria bacterium RIFCSPHIGHO2_01_FU
MRPRFRSGYSIPPLYQMRRRGAKVKGRSRLRPALKMYSLSRKPAGLSLLLNPMKELDYGVELPLTAVPPP